MRNTTARWLVPLAAALAVLVVVAVIWQQRPGASGEDVGAGSGGDTGQGSPPSSGSAPGDGGLEPMPDQEPPTGVGGGGDVDLGMISASGFHSYDATHLAIVYANGVPECYGEAGTPKVVETDDAVTVTIPRTPVKTDPDTACIDLAVIGSVDITLDAPLGDRVVKDGSRGGAVLDRQSLPGAMD